MGLMILLDCRLGEQGTLVMNINVSLDYMPNGVWRGKILFFRPTDLGNIAGAYLLGHKKLALHGFRTEALWKSEFIIAVYGIELERDKNEQPIYCRNTNGPFSDKNGPFSFSLGILVWECSLLSVPFWNAKIRAFSGHFSHYNVRKFTLISAKKLQNHSLFCDWFQQFSSISTH